MAYSWVLRTLVKLYPIKCFFNLKDMITVNKNGFVSARELQKVLGNKTDFTTWIKRMLDYGFEEGLDFSTILMKSTGGRRQSDYLLTIDCSKEIAMIQRTEKGKELRKYLLSLDNKKEEGLLLNHEEILELNPLVEASFIKEFRDKARNSHLSLYLPSNAKGKDYAKANNKRNTICGINREEIAKRLYQINQKSKSLDADLIKVDKYELIRIAVIDCMLFFGKTKEYAINIGNLCKKLAIKNERVNFDRANTMYLVPKEYLNTIVLLK